MSSCHAVHAMPLNSMVTLVIHSLALLRVVVLFPSEGSLYQERADVMQMNIFVPVKDSQESSEISGLRDQVLLVDLHVLRSN